MITIKNKNEGTQVSDVNTGRPADTSITVKKKKNEMNESLSLDDIKDAKSGTYISVGNKSYSKVKKGLWQQDTNSAHGIGATYSDSQMYNLIKDKDAKLNESVSTNANNFNIMYSALERQASKNKRDADFLDKIDKMMMDKLPGLSADPAKDFDKLDKATQKKVFDYTSQLSGIDKRFINESLDMNEKSEYQYTDDEKKDIFKRWSNYTKKKYGYTQQYSYKAFNDAMYQQWDAILAKENGTKPIHESADMTQVSTLESQGCDGEAVAVPCASEEPVAEPMPKKDDSQKFTDIKYMTILNILKANGYEGTRFFGSEGYLIPDKYPNTMVRLVCRTISEGFKVNVLGGLYDLATSKDCMKQLRECNLLADKLNQLLIEDNDINEMIDAQILTPDEEELVD